MRERRKEPREGSEIDPETVCIQTVGAPTSSVLDSFEECCVNNATQKIFRSEVYRNVDDIRRVFEVGVTAYLLYNGSATYIQ